MIKEFTMQNFTIQKQDSAKMVTLIDLHIGKKIISLRKLKKMSRALVAEKVGITHQQLQKYENGLNRISASRLYDLAKFFGVSILVFFPEDF
jgi:transcriptional regulator with XRE-family HTH domain